VPELIQMLKSPDQTMRGNCAAALGNMGAVAKDARAALRVEGPNFTEALQRIEAPDGPLVPTL
jgi:hypothetical protein